jgi:hypothetical protein
MSILGNKCFHLGMTAACMLRMEVSWHSGCSVPSHATYLSFRAMKVMNRVKVNASAKLIWELHFIKE